jgi:hypothetical protein
MEDEMAEKLKSLHSSFLKGNEYDEADLIFYRITYRLAEELVISKDDAAKLHSEYHVKYPRSISRGYCKRCRKLVSLIPIIYGIQESELAEMKERELAGKLIVGSTDKIKQGIKVAMFGCNECKSSLLEYGTL